MKTKEELENDLRIYKRNMAEAVNRRDYVKMELFARKISETQGILDEYMEHAKFHMDTRNEDKALTSFAGKTLSLSLNEADLALYHLDMFFAYFKDRGFVSKPGWEKAYKALRDALTQFREYSGKLFTGKSQENNLKDLGEILGYIRQKLYTDRELKYYDIYENKANEL